MQGTNLPIVNQTEHAELDVVASSLARTPKLANLLRYLVNKYFAGESDQLTEYNIAIEVFGRNKEVFIASEDAIARVQTHRLRKRLKAFYDTEGRHHRLRISIPLGTYTPEFARYTEEGERISEQPASLDLAEGEAAAGNAAPASVTAQPTETAPQYDLLESHAPGDAKTSSRSFLRTHPVLIYAGVAVVGVLLAIGFLLLRRQHGGDAASPAQNAGAGSTAARQNLRTSQNGTQAASFPVATVPLRIIAGYDGPPEKDSSGNTWEADHYFRGGWDINQSASYVAGTSDPLIFRYGRGGDCDYDIPLDPGIYELHLYFFQRSALSQSEDAEDHNVFNVAINGETRLSEFDIVSDAMGRNIADERVLRDISPSADGKLHLHLSTVIGMPSLSAIQILKGTPHKQLPIRVITQPAPFTDRNGSTWNPDNYFLGGRHLAHNLPENSSDHEWLSTERHGHFMYAFPVDTRDQYTLVLHFKELFFGSDAFPNGSAGKRVFRVMCNGNILLDNFDIYKEAGADHTLLKTFHHLKPTAQGKLNLTFEPILGYATISALEVIDESE